MSEYAQALTVFLAQAVVISLSAALGGRFLYVAVAAVWADL